MIGLLPLFSSNHIRSTAQQLRQFITSEKGAEAHVHDFFLHSLPPILL